MNAIAQAHLLSSLQTLIRDAQGDGSEYEVMTLIESILNQAGAGGFDDALAVPDHLQTDLHAAHPLDTGVVGPPIVVLN